MANPEGPGRTAFGGMLLSNGGKMGRNRRRFTRHMSAEFNGFFMGRHWTLNPGLVGAPQASGAATTLYNLGNSLKIGGLGTVTGRGNGDGFNHSTDGWLHALCPTAANTSTVLSAPRVFGLTRGGLRTYIRMRVQDVASQDIMFGLVEDDTDASSYMDAGGAENINNGVILHRQIADALNQFTLSVVASGTPVSTVVTLPGNLANDVFFELGLMVDATQILALACNDVANVADHEVAVVNGNATQQGVLVAALAAGGYGPTLGVHSTDATNEYFDVQAWGAFQPFPWA